MMASVDQPLGLGAAGLRRETVSGVTRDQIDQGIAFCAVLFPLHAP